MTVNIKKLPKINKPAEASIWYIGTSVITKAILLIFTPIFTRLLSPEKYGLHSLYVSWMGILTVLTTPQTAGNAIYRGFSRFSDDKRGFALEALKIQFVLTPISLALYMIFANKINAILGLGKALTVLLLVQIFLNSIIGLYLTKERFSYHYKKVCTVNLISGIAYPILSLLILMNKNHNGEARIQAQFAISLATAIPLIIIMLKEGGKSDGEKRKYVMKNMLCMLPHYLSLSVIAGSDKITIGRMASSAMLGKYSIAHSTGSMLSLITVGISGAVIPWLNRKLKSGEENKVAKTLHFGMILITELTLIFLCFIPEAFQFIGGQEYLGGLAAVYPIALSVPVSFLSGIHTGALLHLEEQKTITSCSVAGAALCVVLQLLFVKHLGYTSAAIATLISHSVLLMLYAVSYRHKCKKNLIFVNKYLLLLVFSGVFAMILYLSRSNPFLRGFLFLGLVLTFVFTAKKCKNLIFESD